MENTHERTMYAGIVGRQPDGYWTEVDDDAVERPFRDIPVGSYLSPRRPKTTKRRAPSGDFSRQSPTKRLCYATVEPPCGLRTTSWPTVPAFPAHSIPSTEPSLRSVDEEDGSSAAGSSSSSRSGIARIPGSGSCSYQGCVRADRWRRSRAEDTCGRYDCESHECGPYECGSWASSSDDGTSMTLSNDPMMEARRAVFTCLDADDGHRACWPDPDDVPDPSDVPAPVGTAASAALEGRPSPAGRAQGRERARAGPGNKPLQQATFDLAGALRVVRKPRTEAVDAEAADAADQTCRTCRRAHAEWDCVRCNRAVCGECVSACDVCDASTCRACVVTDYSRTTERNVCLGCDLDNALCGEGGEGRGLAVLSLA